MREREREREREKERKRERKKEREREREREHASVCASIREEKTGCVALACVAMCCVVVCCSVLQRVQAREREKDLFKGSPAVGRDGHFFESSVIHHFIFITYNHGRRLKDLTSSRNACL